MSQDTSATARPTPDQAGHPDHAMYQQIREGVAAIDAQHGRSFDATSERLTASLLPLAKENGLSRVDHVVLGQQGSQAAPGQYVFVVQGALDNPAHLRAHTATAEAVQTPVEASFQRVQATDAPSLARERSEEQLRQQNPQHAPPSLG